MATIDGELGGSHGRRWWLDGGRRSVTLHSGGTAGRRTKRGVFDKDMLTGVDGGGRGGGDGREAVVVTEVLRVVLRPSHQGEKWEDNGHDCRHKQPGKPSHWDARGR